MTSATQMPVYSLLCVQGPLQLIAAFNAYRWKCQNDNRPRHTSMVIYDLAASPAEEPKLLASIQLLARNCGLDKIVVLASEEMRGLSKMPRKTAVGTCIQRLGTEKFDELYMAFGWGSFGSQLIGFTYSSALKFVYGDSFGLIGSHNNLRLTWRKVFRNPLPFLKGTLKRAIYGSFPEVKFDEAILALPIDWTGHELDRLPLSIPPKSLMSETIATLATGLLDTETDTAGVNLDGVVLLSNLHEAGMATAEAEYLLYRTIVLDLIATGMKTVMLKPHPRSGNGLATRIVEELGSQISLSIADDEVLSKLPIEIWALVVKSKVIVPIYSTSAINLAYLYGNRLMLTLNDARIKATFYSDKVQIALRSNRMVEDCIHRLSTWDGRAILWSRVLSPER